MFLIIRVVGLAALPAPLSGSHRLACFRHVSLSDLSMVIMCAHVVAFRSLMAEKGGATNVRCWAKAWPCTR